MNSMTGFGAAAAVVGGRDLEVEVRTVNHRFLSVRALFPSGWERHQQEVERLVRAHLRRGQVIVRVEVHAPSTRVAMEEAVERLFLLHRVLTRAKRRLGQRGPVPFEALLGVPAWLSGVGDDGRPPAELWPAAVRLLGRALRDVARSRRREGVAIAREMHARLRALEARLARIRRLAPRVLAQYQSRLRQRVGATRAGPGAEAAPADLSRELVVFADKADISEELQRLQYHARRMRSLLGTGGPVGRKLEFLVQEMTREVSTLGAKANDAEISTLAIEIRTEIERIREQADNVE